MADPSTPPSTSLRVRKMGTGTQANLFSFVGNGSRGLPRGRAVACKPLLAVRLGGPLRLALRRAAHDTLPDEIQAGNRHKLVDRSERPADGSIFAAKRRSKSPFAGRFHRFYPSILRSRLPPQKPTLQPPLPQHLPLNRQSALNL